jgi:hypothetical protein
MDDWKQKIISRAIWVVHHRIQKEKSGHRIELYFSGEPDLALLLTSDTPITAATVPSVLPVIEDGWIDTHFSVAKGGHGDNDEIRELFHKLWSNAGTTEYNKGDWKRLARALSNVGYKL